MNLNVPVELHNTFKSVTASAGENMTDVLLKFIEEQNRVRAIDTKPSLYGASDTRGGFAEEET